MYVPPPTPALCICPVLYTQLTGHQRSDLFVQFTGWFEDTNSIHIAMEYIADGDLFQYIIGYPVKAKTEAKVITLQILAGLVVLHERGICHRDLKPQGGTHPGWNAACVSRANGNIEHPSCLPVTYIDQNHRLRNLKTLGGNILTDLLRNTPLPSTGAAGATP